LLVFDRKHRWWLIGCLIAAGLAIVVRVLMGGARPGPHTGGTQVGLIYGVLATALMLAAGALALHRRLPVRSWIGQRQSWLRGHIWLGLLSVVFVFCHAGFHWGGPLEAALWVVFAITILSGVLGWIAQAVLPRLLTDTVLLEAPFEQIPALCRRYRHRADEIIEAVSANPALAEPVRAEVIQLHAQSRAFLALSPPADSPLADKPRADRLFHRARALAGMDTIGPALDELQGLCDERRQLLHQARLHVWLHAWLLVHIPITLLLFVLVVAHILTASYW
jgi:hypothetical protein